MQERIKIVADIVERLRAYAKTNDDMGLYPEANCVNDAITEIERLRRGLELYKEERNRFKHANPEITGAYYLSGGIGKVDDNLMPQYVMIVPAYGVGWSRLYERTDRTVLGEGS